MPSRQSHLGLAYRLDMELRKSKVGREISNRKNRRCSFHNGALNVSNFLSASSQLEHNVGNRFSDSQCRTVPTQNDILVPETLLKKRKSQERAREERALATKEKRGT